MRSTRTIGWILFATQENERLGTPTLASLLGHPYVNLRPRRSLHVSLLQSPAGRLSIFRVALALAVASSIPATTHAQSSVAAHPPLPRLNLPQPSPLAAASSGRQLEESFAKAARQSLWEAGTSASWQALRECQAGPYPGSLHGVLGSAQSRPEAQPDHCRRF